MPLISATKLLQGSSSEKEETNNLPKKVVGLTLCSLTIYVLSIITTLAAPETRAMYEGNLWFIEDDKPAHDIDFSYTPIIIGAVVIDFVLLGMVLCCGFSGVKDKNAPRLLAFSLCNGLCALAALCSIISLVAGFALDGGKSYTCSSVADYGFNPTACYFTVLFSVLLLFMFMANSWFSFKLYKQRKLVVASQVEDSLLKMTVSPAEDLKDEI